MTTCVKCGRALNREDGVCPECGEPTAQAPYNYSVVTPPEAAPQDYGFTAPPEAPKQDFSSVTPPNTPLQFGYTPPPDTQPYYRNTTPPPAPQRNVSYVSPPPQYGYAPPPNAPSAPPSAPSGAPPGVNYRPPPPQYGYGPPPGRYNNPGAYNNSGAYVKKPKSKVAAGLLAILVGYGVYNFYLKYYAKAVIQLVGTLLALGLIIYWAITLTENVFYSAFNSAMGMGYFNNMMSSVFSPAYVIGLVLSSGIGLWQFIEGILIFVGTIDRDGEGKPIV